jgi:hypothetical protein
VDDMAAAVAEVRRDLAATLVQVTPMDDDLRAVEQAVKEMAPALQAMKDELAGLRDDLGGLPFVGRR